MSNVHIYGGSSGYILTTDGAGTLSWTSAATASGAYSNANVASYLSGPVLVGNLYIGNSTLSTSTTTGALIINGGAGITGNVNVGGQLSIYTGNMLIAGTNVSTSSSTGALVVYNGVGIGGALYVGGNITLSTGNANYINLGSNSNVKITGGTNGYILTTDGAGNLSWTSVTTASGAYSNTNVASYLSGPVLVGNLYIGNSTASTSTATGALVMNGGAGIAGSMYLGGNLILASYGSSSNIVTNTSIINISPNSTTSTINIGNAVGAAGTTAVNFQQTAAGTVNLDSPVVNGTIGLFTTVTTGTINLGANAQNINFGTASGITTVNSPTVTFANSTTFNINGANPTLASSSTGTLTLFNTAITIVNAFGAAGTIGIGQSTATGTVTLNPTTPSTSTSSGGLQTKGGAGIAGNINVGGSRSLFTNYVGIGTSTVAGINSNVFTVYGTAMHYGNVVLQNTTAGGTGIYFPDGSLQTTAFGGSSGVTTFNAGTTGMTPTAATSGAITLAFGTSATAAGIYTPGANQIALSTASTARLLANANGNILIGTTTAPGAGNGNATVVIQGLGTNGGGIELVGGAAGGSNIYALNGGGMVFSTYTGAVGSEVSTGRMLINSTGQLIVGNSTGGTLLTAALVVTSSGSQPQIQVAYNSATNGFIVQQTSTGGGVKLYNGDNSELTLGTNNTERMRITALGNVGIGTATVGTGNAMAVFGGNIYVGSTNSGIVFPDGTYQSTAFSSVSGVTSFSAGTTGMTPTAATGGAVTLAFGSAATAAGIYSPTTNTLALSTASTERMRITSTGNLLVGTQTSYGTVTASSAFNPASTAWLNASFTGTGGYGGGLSLVDSGTAGWAIYTTGTGTQLNFAQGPVSAGTAGQMQLLSGGNILLGTQTNTAIGTGVVVVNSAKGGGIVLQNNNSGGGNVAPLGGGGLSFSTFTQAVGSETPTERMRIDSSGNVGLGTTSPATRLDVQSSSAGTATGLIKLYNTNGSDRYTGIDFNGVTSETYNKIAQITAQVTNGATGSGAAIGGDLIFRTNNSATNVPSERMRIDANGNMGLGMTPSSTGGRLQVGAAVNNASAQIAGNANGMSVLNQNGLTFYTNLSGGSTDTTLVAGNTSLTYMAFGIHNGTSYTERMRINSNGAVTMNTALVIGSGGTGLGTVPANGQLLIGNGTNYTLATLTQGTGVSITNGAGSISLAIGQAVATSSSVQFNALGVGTAAGATAGTILATNEITAYSSDARLKDNVQLIADPLHKVLSLRGVMFDWNIDKADKLDFHPHYIRDVGVIAQEVQAVLPEAVRPAPFDMAEDGSSRSGEDYLTVQYEKLTALLIEAVKELKSEVDTLKARLDAQ